jgi:hypothetical protein
MTYRLREPLQVIREEPPKPISFVEIMPGSIITVKGEGRQSGRVEVLYDGQILAAFMRDIEARADMVESKSAI